MLPRPVTARTRIVGWMLLLVIVALGASIAITHAVLVARLDGRISDELGQEAGKLRAYAKAAIDPDTGRPFTDVAELLDHYLRRNLPDRRETFFTVVDGKAVSRSADSPPVRLDTDRSFVRRVAAIHTPSSGSVDTRVGEVRYAVLPVRLTTDQRPAALVVLEFAGIAKAHQVDQAIWVLTAVAGVTVVLAGVASWLIAGRVLAPIRLVRRTAEDISGSDLSKRIEVSVDRADRNDDVAALANTFNSMLDRLENAFTAQREFLDDVGHELRTPVTVVRGHLELMGEDPQDTEDTEDTAERTETIALVTDELDRMARIVDDLLVLANSRRPDFLTHTDIDTSDLTVDVLAKARVLADRSWTLDQLSDVRFRGDPQRLTQALLQLVSNAVRYTSDGDVIAIGSAADEAHLRFWVRDNGSGIPAEVAGKVFDRFVRAGPRSGAGLGLAIVRVIAEAHGGTATLRTSATASDPSTTDADRGTTVLIEVPR